MIVEKPQYIVRRLTPVECARLQGFPDCWGIPDTKQDFTEEEYRFWLDVRNTHAAINGKAVKDWRAVVRRWKNYGNPEQAASKEDEDAELHRLLEIMEKGGNIYDTTGG